MAKVFRLVGKGRLQVSDGEALLHRSKSLGSESSEAERSWIDLSDPSRDELTRWMTAYQVPALVQELAVSPTTSDILGDHSSGVLVSKEATHFFCPLFGEDDTSVVRLAGVCTREALITFHKAELWVLNDVQRLAQEGELLPQSTLSALVVAVLRALVHRSAEAARELRQRVRRTSEQLARRDPVELDQVLQLERQVDTLGAVVDEQLTCVRALAVGDGETFILEGSERHFSVITSHLETLDRALDRLDRHVESLRSQYDSRLAEHTNRRLATLTVFSAVFMPLSLIAGIYGMNFRDMPELLIPGAYPATLAVMGSLAAFLLILFWRKGWFG